MRVDLLGKENFMKRVLFLLRWPIAFFVLFLFALSFLMSKIHPQRVSYEKEYNYLYSIIDDLKDGRVRNFDIIKDKVLSFTSLHPEVDGDLLKYSLKSGNYLDAQTILDNVHKRAGFENSDIRNFSSVSLEIEKDNSEKAYKQALSIKDSISLKNESPFLYAYNLYRVFILEKMQNNKEKATLTAKEFKNFMEEIKDTNNFQNPLIQQIYKKMNKES